MAKQHKGYKYYVEHKEEYLKKDITKMGFLALANCAIWGITLLIIKPPEWVVTVWGVVFVLNIIIVLSIESRANE